ncbi:MAG: hypothetical protein IJ491_09780 [Clostridia bacterium]|nr:hypothetical protein [Clostridia bacterium]
MGAYAVMFPDKKYINLLDESGEDRGSLGHKFNFSFTGDVQCMLKRCTLDGKSLNGTVSVTSSEPSSPVNGQIWIDTSGDKSVYKKWDENTSQWVQMGTTYFLLSYEGIDKGFSKWDTVKISGLEAFYDHTERAKEQVLSFNADSAIIYNVVEDGLVFSGILDEDCIVSSPALSVERIIPDMDFVIECNNRLWGCKYGVVNGKVVNEIYASRQGDFKNWYAYLGVSTDSYAVSVGSEGAFTGAAVYNKCPVFFKENCIHMIYGSTPSSYQMVTINCEGVEKGQADSVCIAENVLYYKGATGFYAFSGSLPQKISRNLGEFYFPKVIGEGVGDRVYWACGDEDGEKDIYVYDTYYQLWHREDSRNIKCFSKDGHILYMLVHENGESRIESVTDETDIEIKTDSGNFPIYETAVQWAVESVDIGYGDINMKYVKKITVRAQMSEGSSLSVFLSCDGEPFVKVGATTSETGVRSNQISFSPRRCEFFRYRLEGVGEIKIVSIKKTMIQGSDKP